MGTFGRAGVEWRVCKLGILGGRETEMCAFPAQFNNLIAQILDVIFPP